MKTFQKAIRYVVFSMLLMFQSSCDQSSDPDKISYDIYHGGDIISMTSDYPEYKGSVVIDKNKGRVAYLGPLDISKKRFPTANLVDIKGATILPGFIDGHAHFAGFPAQAIGAKILPPPDAGVDSIAKLITTLETWATPENTSLTGWIFGMGFDDSVVKEKRMPTRYELDQVSTEFPIMVIHISGHLGSVNSKALEIIGYNEGSSDPVGGKIRRFKGSNTPNGILEELAIIPLMSKYLSPKSKESALIFLESGQELALSYGYTTIQEGRAFKATHDFIKQAAESDLLKLDVISYIDHTNDELMYTKWFARNYYKGYRIGGVKLSLDGSPQGRTAWITKPYKITPQGKDISYRGYPAIPEINDVVDIYDKAYKNNWQILTHANGDAAMDQMISALKVVDKRYPKKDRRNVLIHGQYVRFDQLDEYKDLDIITSFFPMHTFYWGDWHKKLIGDKKGNSISPTRTALDKGLKITIHTDAPVAMPNLMRLVWTATKRQSRSGDIVGAKERLTVYEALQAITIWSAHQHFEEKTKGSLAVNKIADMVILDKNPLKVSIDEVKEIKVLQTIKNGVVVYSTVR